MSRKLQAVYGTDNVQCRHEGLAGLFDGFYRNHPDVGLWYHVDDTTSCTLNTRSSISGSRTHTEGTLTLTSAER